MPGSGKSTIGKALAKQLAKIFYDSDDEIVKRCGVDIPTIFEIEGEAGFRLRERAVLADISQQDGIVMATGGGAILNEETRSVMRERGQVIYLQASIDELVRRTKRDNVHQQKRPLLKSGDIYLRLQALYDARASLYNAAAHLVVDVDHPNATKSVAHILRALNIDQFAQPERPNP